MISLDDRIEYLQNVFNELQYTNSRLDKEAIVNSMPEEFADDFKACLEVLDGQYVFGFKIPEGLFNDTQAVCDFDTVREIFDFLLIPIKEHNLSEDNIECYVECVSRYIEFLTPIVNRTLRLGIGRSLLTPAFNAPMLAKKFGEKPVIGKLYITEKLDGNRCIAHWDGKSWVFSSRSGKRMHVDFDMSGMNKQFVYDGEVLSSSQSQLSEYRVQELLKEAPNIELFKGSNQFNTTSGIINRHDTRGKDLVYHVFDIQSSLRYEQRRVILNNLKPTGNVVIVPLIATFTSNLQCWNETMDASMCLLDKITSLGGEGLMFNLNTGYEHKRTNNILKFKKVKTMDMVVREVYAGRGKYECAVGTMKCVAIDGNNYYECMVGTGLSDEQRDAWYYDSSLIVGKIVEIAYFEASQNSSLHGTNCYSLRFPRLIKIRTDKIETSTQ